MKSESAIDRVSRALHSALDKTHADLDRIEILSAALDAFGKPIPDYEPGFRHLRDRNLSAHQIG